MVTVTPPSSCGSGNSSLLNHEGKEVASNSAASLESECSSSGAVSRIPREDDLSVYPVAFTFDTKYQLKSVKVVNAAEFATNKYAHPLWFLISASNSLPTKVLIYGANPRGMKPEVAGAKPQPLQPKVNYLLLVQARETSGQIEFQTSEVVRTPNQ